MKKKIGLILLLIAVTASMAFAKEGDKVKFKQLGHEDDVKITNVTQSANGIKIEYKGLNDMTIGLHFFIVAIYKDNTTNDDSNHEMLIKKDKTYSFKMKTDRQPSEITMVNISLGKSTKEAQETLLLPTAEQILDIGSKLPDLDGMCWAYSTLVSAFDKIDKLKSALTILKEGRSLYQASKDYREATTAGSKEAARISLLKSNLKFIEATAGQALGSIQGRLLSVAVEGVIKTIDIMNAYYANIDWQSECIDNDCTDLAEQPFIKYASLGKEWLNKGKSVDEIREIFIALNTLDTNGKNDNISSSSARAKNTAKTKGRSISYKQFNYQDAVDIWHVEETKKGIRIQYNGKKNLPKGLVFLARVKYNDGTTKDYYNTEKAIMKNMPWYPTMKTDFPSSISFVTIYLGTSKADAEKIAAADKPAVAQTIKYKIQNNTGAAISVIEIKLSSGWSSVSTGNLAKGANREITASSTGTYDLRVRTAVSLPKSDIYIKKNVKIENGITVTFAAGDKYTQTRADYQAFIQARCKFGDPKGVWAVMDKHPSAEDLYRIWAQSYPDTAEGTFPYTRASKGKSTDQEVIQAQCKFGKPQAVWDVIAKHKNANDLLKKWADSYFKK